MSFQYVNMELDLIDINLGRSSEGGLESRVREFISKMRKGIRTRDLGKCSEIAYAGALAGRALAGTTTGAVART
jgi:hypothetical protein